MFKFLKRYKWRILIITLLTPVVLLFIWREYRLWKIPDIGEPFDVEAFLEPYRDAEQNGMDDYLEAEVLLVDWDKLDYEGAQEDRELYRSEYNAGHPYHSYLLYEPDIKAAQNDWRYANRLVRKHLEENLPAIEKFKKGLDKNYALVRAPLNLGLDEEFEVYRLLSITAFQNTPRPVKSVLPFLLLRASQLTHENDYDGAWEIYKSVHRAERQLRTAEKEVARHRMNYRDISDAQLHRFIASEELTAEQLRRYLYELRELRATMPPVSTQVKWSYLAGREIFSELQALAGHYGFLYGLSNEKACVLRYQALWFHHLMPECDLPASERPELEEYRLEPIRVKMFGTVLDRPAFKCFPFEGTRKEGDVEYSQADLKEIANSLLFSDMANSDVYYLLRRDGSVNRAEVKIQALYLCMALQCYYREHQEFPETLDLLIPDYLEEIPGDVYNQGKPLKYRREGKGARVWSVSLDGQDDSGQNKSGQPFSTAIKDEGDTFFPVYAPGTRYQRPPVTAEKWKPEVGVYRLEPR